jgi:hypothetical protein
LNNLKAPSQNDGFLQKGRRRSKKDKINRNYICGCSKTYLSYPALYTHIKNKHNSKAPKGTIVPSVNPQKKSQTTNNSSASKSNINKSLIGEQAKKENTSQLEEDDFMKGRLKDGHVIDKEFAKKEKFIYNFNMEDFELVNFLGFQGNCDPEYSFYESRKSFNNRVKSLDHLENVKEFLNKKINKVFNEIEELEKKKEEQINSNTSNKEESEESLFDDNEDLILGKRKRKSSFEETPNLKKVKKSSQNISIDDLINSKQEFLDTINQQKTQIDKKLKVLEMKKNSNNLSENDLDDEEEKLKNICSFKKNPLFHTIKEGKPCS